MNRKPEAYEKIGSIHGFEPGDLRAVEVHVKALIQGREEAETALLVFGRDAAGIVGRLAEEKRDDRLKQLARKLVAMPPQVKTNLFPLRSLSVAELIARAHAEAPNATDLRVLEIPRPQVAIFDPLRIAEALVKGGRVRRDAARVIAGDLVWFGSGRESTRVAIATSAPPERQAVSTNRLRVDSGVVFVGPPEASDGPRLGEVRLDAFRTALHAGLEHGRFARLKAGVYVASAYRAEDDTVRVHLTPDPEPGRVPRVQDTSALDDLPGPGSAPESRPGFAMDERHRRE